MVANGPGPTRTDEALRTDHERLQLAVEAGRLGIWEYELASGQLSWDDRMLEIYGLSREAFTGQVGTWRERVHPDDLAAASGVAREGLGEERHQTYEFRVVRPGGETRSVRSDAIAIQGPDGRPVRVVGINQDVTEERRAEAAVRDGAERFRFAIESIPDGFILVDADGRVQDVNPAFLSLTRWSRPALLGRTLRELEGTLFVDDLRAPQETLPRTGSFSFEGTVRRPGGELVPVEVLVRRRQDGGEEFAFVRDIRDRKRTEGLLRTRLLLSELAGTATDRELLTAALDAAEELTSSRIGFFHFVEDDQETLELQAWSTRTVADGICRADVDDRHYPLRQAGAWADCVRQRRAVLHNDFASVPGHHGLPAGHAAVTREATVPVVRRGRVVAVIGVGNKAWDYDDVDVRVLEEIASFTQDLVERARALQALRTSEATHRSLFETMVQGVVYQDAGGRIVSANPAAQAILGRSLDEMTGRTSVDLRWNAVHADGSPWPGESHPSMEALRTGLPVRGALMGVFSPRKNALAWLRIDAIPEVRPGESAPWRVYTTFQDITGNLDAERALQRSEERLRLSLEAAEMGTWEHDLETGVVRMDERARRLLRLDRGEVPSPELGRLVHPDDRERLEAEMAACLAAGTGSGRLATEVRLGFPDGAVRWAAVRARVLLAGEGGARLPQVALGVIQDISARKREEEERLRARTLSVLGSLAAGVAHDLNNVLLAIHGNVQLASEDLEPDHPAAESLAEIGRAGRRAADLVQRILSFSRPCTRDLAPVDVVPVVSEGLKLVRATTPAAIEIRTTFDADLPAVLADASEIQQILVNLVTNSAHAIGRRPGRIDVRLDTVAADDGDRRFVRLAVTDDGCGMSPEELEKAFEPLFTTKPHGQGTGLGLTMVRMAVERCGGWVQARSQLGEGTTLELHFPLALAPPSAPSRPAPPPRERSRGTLLYVDDDDALVLLGVRRLSRLGYEVDGFEDAREALEAFRRRPARFDAVVTDLSMPGLPGFELARELLGIRPDLPIVALSGYVSEEDEETAHRLGVRALLLKPDSVDELARALDRVLSGLDRNELAGRAGARGA